MALDARPFLSTNSPDQRPNCYRYHEGVHKSGGESWGYTETFQVADRPMSVAGWNRPPKHMRGHDRLWR